MSFHTHTHTPCISKYCSCVYICIMPAMYVCVLLCVWEGECVCVFCPQHFMSSLTVKPWCVWRMLCPELDVRGHTGQCFCPCVYSCARRHVCLWACACVCVCVCPCVKARTKRNKKVCVLCDCMLLYPKQPCLV